MLLGSLAGVAAVVHGVLSQMLTRIDRVGDAITVQLERSEQHWRERHEAHARQLARLEGELAAHINDVREHYVSIDRYLETEGRALIQREQIRETLARLENSTHA